MKAPFVRNAYNYDMMQASNESGLLCEDVSLAVQSQAEDADINTIVRRFGLTGVMPEGVRVPSYGDFDQVSDYREALHAVMQAEDNFMRYPAALRARFDNDPQMFLEFVTNPDNIDECVKLGLAVKREVSNGPDSEVVRDASKASASSVSGDGGTA